MPRRTVPHTLRRRLGARVVPVHWTFLLGIVSAACFVVLVVTGVFLLLYYDSSSDQVVYHGSYVPLRGVEMSKALNSTLHISFEVRAGLLMRQAHHWAALVLPASLMLQMLSIFFTGGFRRPRQRAWLLLCGIFFVTLVGGWSGYGLPDDLLAGTGQRIVEGLTIGIPVIGPGVTRLLFGGEFPSQIVAHLYWLHVLLVPLALLPLIALRLRVLHRRGPAQFAGPGRTEDNIVGRPWAVAAARVVGLFFTTVGIVFVMAATATVAPIWLNGPASPSDASNGSQPDWYTSFLDGALRLVPPHWEVTGFGGTWPLALLVPQAVVGLFLAIIVIYPYLEERLTGDRRDHNILDRPRDAPRRTAIGVAGLAFYGTLWGAAGSDVIATHLDISFEDQVYILRVCLFVAPIAAYFLTYGICLGLQDRDRDVVEHGVETGHVVRRPDGGYVEVLRPLSIDDRSTLAGAQPLRHERTTAGAKAVGPVDPPTGLDPTPGEPTTHDERQRRRET
jgi:ubiquinol-cytochrome c reductase cytochrome b subunit